VQNFYREFCAQGVLGNGVDHAQADKLKCLFQLAIFSAQAAVKLPLVAHGKDFPRAVAAGTKAGGDEIALVHFPALPTVPGDESGPEGKQQLCPFRAAVMQPSVERAQGDAKKFGRFRIGKAVPAAKLQQGFAVFVEVLMLIPGHKNAPKIQGVIPSIIRGKTPEKSHPWD